MLSKKIACLLLSISTLTPAATAIDILEPEYAEAASGFLPLSKLDTTAKAMNPVYAIPADLNYDGVVDIVDYTLLRRYINKDGEGVNIPLKRADLNHDGTVDFFDLVALKELI